MSLKAKAKSLIKRGAGTAMKGARAVGKVTADSAKSYVHQVKEESRLRHEAEAKARQIEAEAYAEAIEKETAANAAERGRQRARNAAQGRTGVRGALRVAGEIGERLSGAETAGMSRKLPNISLGTPYLLEGLPNVQPRPHTPLRAAPSVAAEIFGGMPAPKQRQRGNYAHPPRRRHRHRNRHRNRGGRRRGGYTYTIHM